MPNANITNVRRGQAIRLNNDLCVITELQHKTPPNLRAFVQLSAKSIATGKVTNLRLTPNDTVDLVPLMREEHEYSYTDPDGYHFMHPETFVDVIVPQELAEAVKDYLIENNRYVLLSTDDDTVVSIELPPAIDMLVTESPEGVKGDSTTNVYKAATMETGLIVQVPLFIKEGEKIRVNTADGKYLGRA